MIIDKTILIVQYLHDLHVYIYLVWLYVKWMSMTYVFQNASNCWTWMISIPKMASITAQMIIKNCSLWLWSVMSVVSLPKTKWFLCSENLFIKNVLSVQAASELNNDSVLCLCPPVINICVFFVLWSKLRFASYFSCYEVAL